MYNEIFEPFRRLPCSISSTLQWRPQLNNTNNCLHHRAPFAILVAGEYSEEHHAEAKHVQGPITNQWCTSWANYGDGTMWPRSCTTQNVPTRCSLEQQTRPCSKSQTKPSTSLNTIASKAGSGDYRPYHPLKISSVAHYMTERIFPWSLYILFPRFLQSS